MGTVPSGRALLRSGARVGDDIWVSGELGDAALGLAFRRGEMELPATGRETGGGSPGAADAARAFGRTIASASPAARSTYRTAWLVICVTFCGRPASGAVIEWSRVPRSAVLAAAADTHAATLRACRWRRLRAVVYRATANRREEVIRGGGSDADNAHRHGHGDRRSSGAGRAAGRR